MRHQRTTLAATVISVALAAFACIVASGCFSVKIDGEVRAKGRWSNFPDEIECISIDGVEVEVVKTKVLDNEVRYWGKLYAVGDFLIDDRLVTEIAYDKYMSIGILPQYVGWHKNNCYDSVVLYLALIAVPSNVYCLGLNTLCALLVNPFVNENWANERSCGALLGVWRYGKGEQRILQRVDGEGRSRRNVRRIRLHGFAVSVNGGNARSDWNGMFYIGTCRPGEEIMITLTTIPKFPKEIGARLPDVIHLREFKVKIPSPT